VAVAFVQRPIKVEHLLKHAKLLPVLRDTGCAFASSAMEPLDDAVLERLAKAVQLAVIRATIDEQQM
jgi:hypothetical protein